MAYPNDPRRWRALMTGFEADQQLRRLKNSAQPEDGVKDRARLDAIMKDPDAPAEIRSEAAFTRVMTYISELSFGEGAYINFYREAAAFMAKNTDPKEASRMKMIELHVIAQDPSPRGDDMLKPLVSDADEKVAKVATDLANKRSTIAGLRTKPVDLAFTAADGQEVDLAKMRGKVILVDFWASWCGPCLAEMPNVVAIYKKLHDQGFEVIGISLDDNKDNMAAAIKRQKMTWPQYFDGLGWENKIGRRYGIDAIPATWLIDKKGVVRESNLRGPKLEAAVTRLLQE
jgi:thiol-disulfide isomerase/thioredoxin